MRIFVFVGLTTFGRVVVRAAITLQLCAVEHFGGFLEVALEWSGVLTQEYEKRTNCL